MWVVADKTYWGPKPIKVNNIWFRDRDFLHFVEKEWRGLEVVGRSDFVLKENLRLLKSRLSLWNIEVFGKFYLEVEGG